MPGKGTHYTKSKLLQKKYFYRLDADDPEMKKFSSALGAYIERHGWNAQEAADQIGIDDRTLLAWLEGETGPMDNTAYEIDDLLGLGVWNHDEYSDDYYRFTDSVIGEAKAESLSDRLRECRAKNGWTQSMASYILGISLTYVSKIERCEFRIKGERAKELNRALDFWMSFTPEEAGEISMRFMALKSRRGWTKKQTEAMLGIAQTRPGEHLAKEIKKMLDFWEHSQNREA